MAQFTDRSVSTLKPTGTRFDEFDDLVPGLALRVSAIGTKTWTVFFRERILDDEGGSVAGKLRRVSLGRYPVVGLAAARRKARLELGKNQTPRDKGSDPLTGRRRTFGDVASAYVKDYAKVAKTATWKHDERTITTELLPSWKHVPIRTITRSDVQAVLKVIVDRGSPVRSNRVASLISKIFNWALDQEWISANPAARIKKQPETSRDRTLSDTEVQELWKALDTCKKRRRAPGAPAPAISPMIAIGLQLILVTGQRPGEVFRLEKPDLDLASGWWTIPKEKTKNRQTHRVPLGPTAKKLIKQALTFEADCAWVFSGVGGGCVADRAKKAASELTAANAVAFAFHRHDLRRTAASGMARSGVSRDTIAKVMNHVDRGSRSTAVYDRYDYDAEKQVALAAWERRLGNILRGRKGRENVVAFTGLRAYKKM